MSGWSPSDETRAKMGRYRRGRPLTDQHRDRISRANAGFKHSPEAIAKMSEAQSGEKHPNFGKHLSASTRRKIGESRLGEKHWNFGKPSPNRGKTATAETCQKLSNANRGKKFPGRGRGRRSSTETIAKISGPNNHSFGKSPTQETRDKIAAAARLRWAAKRQTG